MTTTMEPDPSMIGGIPKVPLVLLPKDPAALFDKRARRLDFLAGHNPNLKGYLEFLAALVRAQAALARDIGTPAPQDDETVEMLRASRMPQIDRPALADRLPDALDRYLTLIEPIDMPDPSRLALEAVKSATSADRDWLITNILTDTIPDDSVAPHVFVAAAAQVVAALAASVVDPEKPVPIKFGVCPVCGGRPSASVITEQAGAEGLRYANCACCQTQWNEVRIKCLCCEQTGKMSYRSVETDEATIKAEVCGDCHHWVKVLYLTKNATLEAVADDVGSLGLDLRMKDSEFTRGAFNPFLVGL